jgi:AcrR family transcriptional regulator
MKRNFGFTQREDRNESSAAVQIERSWPLADRERRSEVLRAAATQFAITGMHGTTGLMLARATGIPEEILYSQFGGKERLFRETVAYNIGTRLQLLEARALSAVYESEIAAVQHIAEATVTGCAAGDGNSILTNWALLEDHENASDLYRDEIGSVEILWNRAFADNFRDSPSRRALTVDLVPHAVSACLAYGLWLATLRHDAKSAAALAQGFVAGLVQTASALLSEQSQGMCRVRAD